MTSPKKVFWSGDQSMQQHFCPWDTYHIEIPERLKVIDDVMEKTGLKDLLTVVEGREASKDEIAVVHTQRYIDDIASTRNMNVEELEKFCSGYEDIYLNNRTAELAHRAAAAAIDITKKVLQEKFCGFASIRPPGHHAFPDAGCGFCIYNNVVIAAKQALNSGMAERVLIVDWDVHAGQGTQECIENDDRIRLISSHRFENGTFWPNLQQAAVDNKFANTINVPLNEVGMDDSDFLAIVSLVVLPLIVDFNPDLILVSCGFDAALGDPEGEMRLTPAGYATFTRMLKNTDIPVAVILEGGYFLDSVAYDTEWTIRALLGQDLPAIEIKKPRKDVSTVIRQVHNTFGHTYPTFRAISNITKILSDTFDTGLEGPEYRGVRNVSFPYPTRGIYTKPSIETEEKFKTELFSLIKDYGTTANYNKIRIQENDGIRNCSGCDTLMHILIDIAQDPLSKGSLEALSEVNIEKFAEILADYKSILPDLPVFHI